MWNKIKNFFGFLATAWTGGIRGKVGVLCLRFATFMFVRMFFGDVSIQKFIFSAIYLDREQTQLAQDTAKLHEYENHIRLIQNYSPDYIEELGLKYLNIGDKDMKILKI
jgi:hypothetical protein